MCHVSHVTCHTSCVTCQVFCLFVCFLKEKIVKLVGGGSVINDSQKDQLVNKHLGMIKLTWGFPFDGDYHRHTRRPTGIVTYRFKLTKG